MAGRAAILHGGCKGLAQSSLSVGEQEVVWMGVQFNVPGLAAFYLDSK